MKIFMQYIAKYIHGSGDSTDIDTYYIVNKMPSFQEAKQFCDAIKDENANILCIENGVIIACYKGTPDECNNSLLATYSLHQQDYPLIIERQLKRDINLKCIRAIRIILSHLSRTQYRQVVKRALKSKSLLDKIDTLRNIDLSTIEFSKLAHNNMSENDILKVIAFQVGQTLSLCENIELYTKKDVAQYCPDLHDFLYRQKSVDICVINNYVHKLCDIVQARILSEENTITTFIDNSQYDIIYEKRV